MGLIVHACRRLHLCIVEQTPVVINTTTLCCTIYYFASIQSQLLVEKELLTLDWTGHWSVSQLCGGCISWEINICLTHTNVWESVGILAAACSL